MNENPFYPTSKSDKLLFYIEVISVASIALGIFLFIAFEISWVICPISTNMQSRIEAVLKALNANWKVGLLVLIPLFYRTVRTFLELVQKGPGGLERRIQPEAEKEPNPHKKI